MHVWAFSLLHEISLLKKFIAIFGLGYYDSQRTPYLCGVDSPLSTPNPTLNKNPPSHPLDNKGGPFTP